MRDILRAILLIPMITFRAGCSALLLNLIVFYYE